MTRLSGQFDDCRETALDTFEIGRAGKFDSDPGDRGADIGGVDVQVAAGRDAGGHRSYRVVGRSQTEAVLRRATG